MHKLVSKPFRFASKTCRRIASKFRTFVISLENTGCRFEKGVTIGRGVEIRVTDGGQLILGQNVSIKSNCTIIVKRGTLTIGYGGFVGWGSIICANEKIEIGDNCLIAEYVTIRDQNHGIEPDAGPFSKQSMTTSPVVICDNVWIGAKASILAGITINSDSVIGANSVVTKNVETKTIVAGAPAKLIRKL